MDAGRLSLNQITVNSLSLEQAVAALDRARSEAKAAAQAAQ